MIYQFYSILQGKEKIIIVFYDFTHKKQFVLKVTCSTDQTPNLETTNPDFFFMKMIFLIYKIGSFYEK
jgi:hypothetical protein